MAPNKGHGKSKGKQLAPKSTQKYPLVTISPSDNEDEVTEQQAVLQQLVTLEHSYGQSPGGGGAGLGKQDFG